MAAVIELHTGERVADAPHRPQLRLVQGGRSDHAADRTPVGPTSARTYLLRRIAVVAAAAVVVLLVAQVLAGVGRVAADALDAAPAASGRVHVVSPGETAWELAGRYAPELDRRTAVDDLLALNGQAPIRAGQELRLPASFD